MRNEQRQGGGLLRFYPLQTCPNGDTKGIDRGVNSCLESQRPRTLEAPPTA